MDVYSKNFVNLWASTRDIPKENGDRLQEEFLLIENTRQYWVPVDTMIASRLLSAFKANDEITIYFFFLGGFNEKSIYEKTPKKDRVGEPGPDSIRWIFALETFENTPAQKSVQDSFTPQTLRQTIDHNTEMPENTADVWFSPNQVRSKTNVVFTGETRATSEKSKKLLAAWLEQNQFPPDAIRLMQNEARFLEGDKEYWIIMRNTTLDEVKEKVKPGESVFLNTMLLGKVRNEKGTDWLFLCGQYFIIR